MISGTEETPKTVDTNETQREVNRVSVKVPPFWKNNPQIWFTQLESQFVNAGITADKTKYHTVVGNIETEILSQVSDIIISPPSDSAYDVLKNRLISVYADSEERKIKKLLQELDLGDKRPSALLRQMQDLAGKRVGDEFLKSLWLQRLPSQMQPALLAISDIEISKLAMMADKMVDFTNPYSVNAVENKSKTDKPDAMNNVIHDMQQQILEINKKIDKLFKMQTRNRSFSRNRKSRTRSSSRETICWYHVKFGDDSTKCVKPCAYNKKDQQEKVPEN